MNIEICVEYESWNELDIESVVNKCVEAVFSEFGLNHYNVEICFLFTDDDEVKMLNRTYRGIDRATNVLSFPADSIDNVLGDQYDYEVTDDQSCCNICILGSVALAYETICNEAAEQHKSLINHLSHMIIHSVLHLLGYDHSEESSAEQMEALEIKILSKFGIANPYPDD